MNIRSRWPVSSPTVLCFDGSESSMIFHGCACLLLHAYFHIALYLGFCNTTKLRTLRFNLKRAILWCHCFATVVSVVCVTMISILIPPRFGPDASAALVFSHVSMTQLAGFSCLFQARHSSRRGHLRPKLTDFSNHRIRSSTIT